MKRLLLLTFIFSFLSITDIALGQVCGGTFTDPAGPNTNYANNTDYTVTINPTVAGEKVTVTFTSFSTEATWDALYVFDGPSITSPQIPSSNPAGNVPGGLAGGYWGNTIPGPFTSTDASGSLTFRFRSDGTQNLPGWVANVTCALPPTCPPPTQITATATTQNSTTVGWTSTASSWNLYVVPCGSPAPTASSTGFQVTNTNSFVITGLNPLTCYDIYLRSVCSATDTGPWSQRISVTTTQAPPVCGGNFTDPGGPTANYSNDSDVTSVICPNNPGDIVTVTFTSFNVETTWDALYVFDGNSITSPQIASTNPAGNVPGGLAGGYWGTALIGPFTSTHDSGCLTFRFRSDNTATRTGWIANITCVPPPTCPKPTYLIASGATVNSVILSWTNNSTATSFEIVALPCNTFPTASTTGTITSSTVFTLTGLASSTCYNLFVRAICSGTDMSIWSNPVTFTTLTIPPACGGSYKDNGGVNAPYLPNSDQTVSICPVNAGDVVTVTFSSFDLETNADALYVFDGNSLSSPQIASSNPSGNVPGGVPGGYWGNTIPGPFTSSDPSGCLTFRFRSDATTNTPGWIASVTCGPGEDKIVLLAFVDQNNNGIKEVNESFFPHGSFQYQINNSGDIVNAYSPVGRYILTDPITTNSYDFSYQLQGEYAPYYSAGTTAYNDVTIPSGSGMNVLYFPIIQTLTYNDVSVSIVPVSQPRPGLTYINKIIYKNGGQAVTSGTLTFIKPTQAAITNISQSGTVTTTNGFTYTFNNLLPNETRIINITLSIPNTVTANTLLTASASVSAPANDIDLLNNNASLSQIVVNSYDPNSKIEAHGDKIPINQFTVNDYLFYTVRFQNLGTANAIDVDIQDVLNAKIDETSVRMVSASHGNYTMTRINNALAWHFDNIQLVPSSVSPELSTGFVNFKVKLKPGFVVGDIIPNSASILFDTNPAIVTNTFNTKFIAAVLNSNEYALDGFLMYPNPASHEVTFSSQEEKIDRITLTDVLGKTVKTIKGNMSDEIVVDISGLSKGMYLVEITSGSSLKTIKKLIVQ